MGAVPPGNLRADKETREGEARRQKHGLVPRLCLDELRFFKLRHKTDQQYQLWQEGSHPQQIQNEPTLVQKLDYMHNSGYVDDPTHWRYSSARTYAGQGGLIEVCTDWR